VAGDGDSAPAQEVNIFLGRARTYSGTWEPIRILRCIAWSAKTTPETRNGYPAQKGEIGSKDLPKYILSQSFATLSHATEDFCFLQCRARGANSIFSESSVPSVVDANASVASIPSSRTIPNKAKYFRMTSFSPPGRRSRSRTLAVWTSETACV
jgi:hypothetical protein